MARKVNGQTLMDITEYPSSIIENKEYIESLIRRVERSFGLLDKTIKSELQESLEKTIDALSVAKLALLQHLADSATLSAKYATETVEQLKELGHA